VEPQGRPNSGPRPSSSDQLASGASDVQVAHQMGHSKIETTKNIYGHLFAQDRTLILDAMNQAVSRLYAYENQPPGEDDGNDAAA
jgi:integrase